MKREFCRQFSVKYININVYVNLRNRARNGNAKRRCPRLVYVCYYVNPACSDGSFHVIYIQTIQFIAATLIPERIS